MNASDVLIETIHAWGVDVIFGLPGDGINGVFGALTRAGGKIQFIQARHEEMAAFMASAYAKFTGRLGVCIATSGPGASHLIGVTTRLAPRRTLSWTKREREIPRRPTFHAARPKNDFSSLRGLKLVGSVGSVRQE